MTACLFDCRGHVLIALMRIAIDEERVLPVAAATGSFVDVAEIDTGVTEYGQHIHERSRLMGGDEHDRCFVFAGGKRRFCSDDQKARDVVWLVFDMLIQRLHAVDFTGQFRSDCRGVGFISGVTHCSGRAGHRNQFSLRILLAQPSSTLAEDLRLGIDALDLIRLAVGQQRL